MTRYLFILLALYVCFVGLVIAQDTEVVTKDGRTVILKSDGTWITKPQSALKPTAEKGTLLFDTYADTAKLVTDLRLDLFKSEFETEAAYQKRIEDFADKTINPATGKPLNKTLLVLSWSPTYNAEAGIFSFYENIVNLDNLVRPCEWRRGWQEVLIINPPTLKMEAIKARDLKYDLKLAAQGTPIELQGKNLCMIPEKYIIFNKKTQEIYAEGVFDSAFENLKPKSQRKQYIKP